MAQKGRLVFEQNAKQYFEAAEEGFLVLNAGNHLSPEALLSQRITDHLLQGLASIGVQTQFVRQLNMHETLVYDLEPMPVRFRMKLRADEVHAELMDADLGAVFAKPICEILFFKGEKSIPLSFDDLVTLGVVSEFETDELKTIIQRVTDYLAGVYWSAGAILVDFTMSLGRLYLDDYHSVLAVTDDIAPDAATIWDKASIGQEAPIHLDLAEIAHRLRLVHKSE